MDAPKDRLGLEGDEIVDVKCGPERIDFIKRRRGILPAYHMNKEHWVTLLLESSLPKDEVFDLIGTRFG
ncbi:MmcQ/YjbR family DNA-binding protein [Bradyrhizobium sp. CCBAU 51745]|uniref:MmcQ/YjbR family DNA-binding protein n=1 Tax=unclassified Bradyrhizobium TaxID=2631580 RepID=UPI003FA4754B